MWLTGRTQPPQAKGSAEMYEPSSTHVHDAYSCNDCLHMQGELRKVIREGMDFAIAELTNAKWGDDIDANERKQMIRGLELAKSLVNLARTV